MTRGGKDGALLLEFALGCGDFDDIELGEGEEDFV